MVRRLLLLMGLAVLGVAFNHAVGWGYVAMFWWTDRYAALSVPNFDLLGGLSYYILRLIEQAIIFAIPAFLFVSGYFITVATGRSQTTVPWRTVFNRIFYLLVPYLLWSLVMFASSYAQGTRYSILQYLRLLLVGGAAPAYYYIPVIVQLYLLSPVLVPLARNRWRELLVAAFIIQASVTMLRYPQLLRVTSQGIDLLLDVTPNWLFIGYVFWFCLGLAFGFHVQVFSRWLARFKWALLVAACALLVLGIIEWEVVLRVSPEAWLGQKRLFLDEAYSGVAIMAFLAFGGVTYPWTKQLGEIGAKSYGVYLSHTLFQEWSAKIVYHVVPLVLSLTVLFVMLLVVVGIVLPLLLMSVVRTSPAGKYYKYMFG